MFPGTLVDRSTSRKAFYINCLIFIKMFQLMIVRVFHFLPTPNIANVGFISHSFFPPQCFFTCIKSVALIQKFSELKPDDAKNKCHMCPNHHLSNPAYTATPSNLQSLHCEPVYSGQGFQYSHQDSVLGCCNQPSPEVFSLY